MTIITMIRPWFQLNESHPKGGGCMRTRTDLHVLLRVGTGIIGLIALGSCLALAQGSTAAISGVVRDATGAVVPGATVTAKHIESGLTRTVGTNENGDYAALISS